MAVLGSRVATRARLCPGAIRADLLPLARSENLRTETQIFRGAPKESYREPQTRPTARRGKSST
jgi:hypothetical protein